MKYKKLIRLYNLQNQNPADVVWRKLLKLDTLRLIEESEKYNTNSHINQISNDTVYNEQ